jgi:hypothetical protein
MDCSLKRSAFGTTLAQLLLSPALGIRVESSDGEGIYAVLQCSWMVQNGRMVYITATSLLTAIRGLCLTVGSLCVSDGVLSAVDWTTLKVVPPEATRISMTYTAYKAVDCTGELGLVGNNSSPSPFAFDDQTCSPGPIFENVQLFFRASDCTDNAAFTVSKRFPSCSVSQGPLVSAQTNYPQRACVRAETLFKTAMVQDYVGARGESRMQLFLLFFDCSARLLTWQLRLRIMLQIATALNYMHKRSASPAYHRDVKSANVVINDDFVAKLIDCGLSKYVPEQGADAGFHSVAPSMPNMRFGTMQYGTKPRSHPKMATWWHQNIYFGPQNASQSLQSLENIRFPHHRDKSHDQKSFLQKLDTALYMLLRSGC